MNLGQKDVCRLFEWNEGTGTSNKIDFVSRMVFKWFEIELFKVIMIKSWNHFIFSFYTNYGVHLGKEVRRAYLHLLRPFRIKWIKFLTWHCSIQRICNYNEITCSRWHGKKGVALWAKNKIISTRWGNIVNKQNGNGCKRGT